MKVKVRQKKPLFLTPPPIAQACITNAQDLKSSGMFAMWHCVSVSMDSSFLKKTTETVATQLHDGEQSTTTETVHIATTHAPIQQLLLCASALWSSFYFRFTTLR